VLTGELLRHELSGHYAALQQIRGRKQLLMSDLWKQIGAEVERVCCAVEIGHQQNSRGKNLSGLRVAAWNLQRGKNFDQILKSLSAIDADVVLLAEVDNGMGRSGDRHVARALADALQMSYAFSVSYLVLEDDFGENPDGKANSLALAGSAILSRLPIRSAVNVDLPELKDKFSSSEKRLGKKRAVMAELALADGILPVAGCHLDSNASSQGRARQLAELLKALPEGRALIGGDFNSSTYDASSPWALAKDLLHKLFVTGFNGTVDNYLTPEKLYEKPLFAELTRTGFTIEGFNDRAQGTLSYNLHDEYAIEKTRQKVGSLLTWYLRRRLRPWNGIVPARLDWFAGRQLTPRAPSVVAANGASDHSPIVVELV
jgi:endonuclease/exonuclease/phosphatase family metal-dependent hydrolase